MEKDGIVPPSTSPWASPLHMVPKKDGSFRPCGDFRRLNLVTEPDRYPLLNMLDFADPLSGCTVFSKIYLRKCYWQVPVRTPRQRGQNGSDNAVWALGILEDGFRPSKCGLQFPENDGQGHLRPCFRFLLPGRPTCGQPLTRGTHHSSLDFLSVATTVWPGDQPGEMHFPRQGD